jgi:protein-disulfide isomerase
MTRFLRSKILSVARDCEQFTAEVRVPNIAGVACLDSPATTATITADLRVGARLGVQVTPTLIINDSLLPGAPVAAELEQQIGRRIAVSRAAQ